MFGKEAALKIIENSVARKTMVEAGKKAFMKEAVKESAKVITYGAAEQVAQEGLEDLVTSADETITGRNPHTFKDAMRSAASAMIDAVPAAIGMMGVSGVIGGVGTYHGLSHHQEFIQAKMAKYGKESALQEVERESEANMVDRLLEARNKSKLNKEAPAQYAQVVGNQMKAQDMGTLYVDAATAVETPEGFLICKDVPIARTGTHQYRGFEFGGDDPMELYDVHRPEEEVDKKRDRLRCHRKNHRRCLRELWILHLKKKNIPEPVMENLQKEMLKSPQKIGIMKRKEDIGI